MTATIRRLRAGEEDAVLAVVLQAFTSPGHEGNEEVEIVRGTWSACAPTGRLELVATVGAAVVGHVLAAPGRLDGEPAAAGVAPLCVAPAHQGRGIGSALVRELIRRAGVRRWSLLVVLGEPAYYGRFGFTPARPLGLSYPPAGAGSPHFQVLPLDRADPPLRGDFAYAWE